MIVCSIDGTHEKIRKRINYLKNIKRYRQDNQIRYQKNYHEWNRYMKDYNKKRRQFIRSIVLWYFNYTCNSCGYRGDPRVLQLDHINGGGSKEQKAIGPISAYYYKKPAELFQKFQMLCANCNYLKRYENNEW